jgi:hypothetical protein
MWEPRRLTTLRPSGPATEIALPFSKIHIEIIISYIVNLVFVFSGICWLHGLFRLYYMSLSTQIHSRTKQHDNLKDECNPKGFDSSFEILL